MKEGIQLFIKILSNCNMTRRITMVNILRSPSRKGDHCSHSIFFLPYFLPVVTAHIINKSIFVSAKHIAKKPLDPYTTYSRFLYRLPQEKQDDQRKRKECSCCNLESAFLGSHVSIYISTYSDSNSFHPWTLYQVPGTGLSASHALWDVTLQKQTICSL